MTAGPAHDVGPSEDERAQAPIRWPRPDRFTLGLIAVWVIGLVIALAVPATIVPPTARHPSTGQTWFAFLFTVIGALIMLTVAALNALADAVRDADRAGTVRDADKRLSRGRERTHV